MSKDEMALEEQLEAKGLNAPRLTPTAIDHQISVVQYHQFPNTTTTVCALTLQNGFCVIGESSCAHPDNFNVVIGRELAFKNAREKIWMLEGYRLRSKLSGQD